MIPKDKEIQMDNPLICFNVFGRKQLFFLVIVISVFCILFCSCVTNQQYSRKKKHMDVRSFQHKKRSVQISPKNYMIYNHKQERVSIESIIYSLKDIDVVFIGEMHDDPVAHYFQKQMLKEVFEHYFFKAYASKRRQIVLSMEMFERDVQIILDEYLFDIIDERHFLASSRAWNNYLFDYHPLVKFAKKNNIRVLAANAPRRYVHRVAQYGKKSLNDLSSTAKAWVAPLPYKEPSKALTKRFEDFQKKASAITPAHDNDLFKKSHFLEAHNLWDATMAFSLSEELANTPKVLIIHLNGYFHSQSGLGIPEHLANYRPDVKMMTITIVRSNNFPDFDSSFADSGDYIIITESVE